MVWPSLPGLFKGIILLRCQKRKNKTKQKETTCFVRIVEDEFKFQFMWISSRKYMLSMYLFFYILLIMNVYLC